MNIFSARDAFFMPPGYEVHPLELLAREQDLITMGINGWGTMVLAMKSHNKAIQIRNRPDWQPYRQK